jgi:hypothetical protein
MRTQRGPGSIRLVAAAMSMDTTLGLVDPWSAMNSEMAIAFQRGDQEPQAIRPGDPRHALG